MSTSVASSELSNSTVPPPANNGWTNSPTKGRLEHVLTKSLNGRSRVCDGNDGSTPCYVLPVVCLHRSRVAPSPPRATHPCCTDTSAPPVRPVTPKRAATIQEPMCSAISMQSNPRLCKRSFALARPASDKARSIARSPARICVACLPSQKPTQCRRHEQRRILVYKL